MSFEEEFYVTIATGEENTLDMRSRDKAMQNTVSNYCSNFHKLCDRLYFSDISIS